MKRLCLAGLVAIVAVSTAAFARMGGWAVVSVSKIPDYWVAGKPLQLSWKVRQHGQSELDGLEPIVTARSGSRTIKAVTWAFNEDGERGYRARITFPQPGEWQVTINSGFGKSRAVLIPWRVVDSAGPIQGTVEEHLEKIGYKPFPEPERGRRMFAAKGCVTCHVHRSVDIESELKDFGPDLTDRRFPSDYLAKFLADPSIKPATMPNRGQMPNPRLREKDIGPLVAFINADRRVARTRE